MAFKDLFNYFKKYAPDSIFVFGSSLGEKDVSLIKDILYNSQLYIFDIDEKYDDTRFPNTKLFLSEKMDKQIFKMMNDLKNQKNTSKSLKVKEINEYQLNINEKNIMESTIFAINAYANKNCIIVADAGNHFLNALSLIYGNKSLFVDAGLAAMGNGICTSIGLSFSKRNKKIICITGDGCILMNGNSIYLAEKYKLNIVFIVYCNYSYGRVKVGQEKYGCPNELTNISEEFNLEFYAKSFGIRSYTVESVDEFKLVLKNIENTNGPIMINVLCDKNEVPVFLR